MTIDDALKSKHHFEKVPRKALERFGHWVENNKSVLTNPTNRSHTAVYIHGMGEVIEEAYRKENAAFAKVQELKNMLYRLEAIVLKRSTIDQSLLAAFFTKYKDAFDWFEQKKINPDLNFALKGLWDGNCMDPFINIFGNGVNL